MSKYNMLVCQVGSESFGGTWRQSLGYINIAWNKHFHKKKMCWLTQRLRIISFRWNQVSWQHSILRGTSFSICIEKEKYRQFVSSCRWREKKMSGTCSLLPPFGDPWPSCLLPSHWFSIFLMELSNKFWILLISTHLKLIKITLLFLKYIYFLYCICIASVSFPWFWWVVATVWLPCARFSLRWLPLSCSTGSQARWLQ